VIGTRGRRLRLAGVSVCNRTAAGQPDVELLCLGGLRFSAERCTDGSSIPTYVGGHQGSRSKRSAWVVTVTAVRWCRRDGDGDKTRKEIGKTIERTSMSSGTTSENPIYSPGSRGGWMNPNFKRWVNRSSGS
jgi:hypothetical protein